MFSLHRLFSWVAFLEGVSYLLLLFVAVPIKYTANDPTYVKLLGMPHGLLFITYIFIAILIRTEKKWNLLQTAIVLAGSLIPFGTFYVDYKYLKEK